MRLLVCGGREFADKAALFDVLDAVHRERPVEVVIQGGARGADQLAYVWAVARSVQTYTFEADWNRYGTKAGPIRNQEMLDRGKPDLVVAFPGGRGTADMVRRATIRGVEVRDLRTAQTCEGEPA